MIALSKHERTLVSKHQRWMDLIPLRLPPPARFFEEVPIYLEGPEGIEETRYVRASPSPSPSAPVLPPRLMRPVEVPELKKDCKLQKYLNEGWKLQHYDRKHDKAIIVKGNDRMSLFGPHKPI